MSGDDDLFHSNPGAGIDLGKLYNMPTPVQQQQHHQHQAFMAQASPAAAVAGNPFLPVRAAPAPPPPTPNFNPGNSPFSSPNQLTGIAPPLLDNQQTPTPSQVVAPSSFDLSDEFLELGGDNKLEDEITEPELDKSLVEEEEAVKQDDGFSLDEIPEMTEEKVKDGDEELRINAKDGSVIRPEGTNGVKSFL